MRLEPSTRRPLAAPCTGRGCLLGVVLLLCEGCSWAFVRRPTSDELASVRAPECTRSVAAPVVDTVFATGFMALGLVALKADSRCVSDHEGFCGLDVGVAIAAGVIAIPFIVSSVHGYTATAECRELERGSAWCLTGVERSCRSPDLVGGQTRFALAVDPDR